MKSRQPEADIYVLADCGPARVEARILDVSEREVGRSWLLRTRFEEYIADARETIGRFLLDEMEHFVL